MLTLNWELLGSFVNQMLIPRGCTHQGYIRGSSSDIFGQIIFVKYDILGWSFSKINSDIFGCKNFINSNVMRSYEVNWLL